jgi:cyclase
MDRYASWTDGERIAVTAATIYRELSGDHSHADRIGSFDEMAELAKR